MRVLPLLLLILIASAFGQDSRPTTQPSFDSDETLRLLAASVTPSRISARIRELRTFGPLVPGSDAAKRALAWAQGQLVACGPLSGATPCQRVVVLSARLSNEGSAAALLEAARVLAVTRKAGQLGDLGFDVRCEFDDPSEEPTSRSASAPSVELAAEIRFGAFRPEWQCDGLQTSVSADWPLSDSMVQRVDRLLGRFKGERGFWTEFAVLRELRERNDRALRITVDALRPAGMASSKPAVESRPATGPARDEAPSAVRAVRFALMMIAALAAERPR